MAESSRGPKDDKSPPLAQNVEQPAQLRPVLEPGVIKAFAAGLVIGNLNKGMLFGFLIGAVGGVYVQQNLVGIPNVIATWNDLKKKWQNSSK